MRIFKIFLTLFLIMGFVSAEDFSQGRDLSFVLTDINGNTYHIKHKEDGLDIPELKGRVVFIAFFGHRCPPCRMEISGFKSFTEDKEYAKKAVILAMEVQGLGESGVREFANSLGINYIVVPGSNNYDFVNYISYRTKWNNGIPFMVVLDSNGVVKNFGNGIVSEGELKSLTDEFYVKQDNFVESNLTIENNNTKQKKGFFEKIKDYVTPSPIIGGSISQE